MRLLVTIPHYFRRAASDTAAVYGSEGGNAAERAMQVGRCLAALHQTFGPRQDLSCAPKNVDANTTLRGEVEVVVVTAGDQHLVEMLPRHLFTQVMTEVEPRHLGFACHEVMRNQAGHFDYYAYLEDDLEVSDALFLNKLAWFTEMFGHSALLQPNRYELADDLEVMKRYVDGNTTAPGLPEQFQDTRVRPRLLGEALGRSFLFERVNNVHAGCFFLNASQLARIARSPRFGSPNAEFFGPLETAATMMIMRTFEVYKPARENAAFLELQHLGRRFLFPKMAEDGSGSS